jgi:hypothetical protein
LRNICIYSCDILYIYINYIYIICIIIDYIRSYNYSRKLFIANDLLGNNYSTIVTTSLAHCPSVLFAILAARIQGRQMLILMCHLLDSVFSFLFYSDMNVSDNEFFWDVGYGL